MIATYIQELLATNNRVIIPNYGAFLVRATSKSKDANTLEEKLKDIYFSPFLKFNDELLEKYIIKKENITKEQAAQKITQFIEDVKKELDQEKPYIIERFGQFVADKQGKVQFLTLVKEDAKEIKKTETKPTLESKTTTSKKDVKTDKKPTVTTTKVTEKTDEKPNAAEVKKADIKEPKKETKPDIPSDGLKEFKAEKKESKAAPVATQTKPIYSYKKKKKPINKGLVLSIAIGLPVAAIFVWAILNFNTVKKVFVKEKVKTEKETQTKKSETVNKPTVKPKENKVKTDSKTDSQADKTPKVKKPTTPQKRYYIIAGSFKNEKYASSYLNKLKAEGYNAEKLKERNGMYAISFNSFTDKRKAIAEYKFISQEKGLQAWILYY